MNKDTIVQKSNMEAINKKIAEAEGRATARCIGYGNIDLAVKDIERALRGIPKKYWEGIEVSCDPNSWRLPKSYKYRADSTQFDLRYWKGKWRVGNIRRAEVTNRDAHYSIRGEPSDLLIEGFKTKMHLF